MLVKLAPPFLLCAASPPPAAQNALRHKIDADFGRALQRRYNRKKARQPHALRKYGQRHGNGSSWTLIEATDGRHTLLSADPRSASTVSSWLVAISLGYQERQPRRAHASTPYPSRAIEIPAGQLRNTVPNFARYNTNLGASIM
ncbi:hypothetical protein HPB50_004420 [Hyalomma asiaticum]|uniref:Uncharacterized protein n=1 Tax=Hyalomma asiaticum TaxID=266040 RepID=A0ACB7TF01_HYAAI|nr:hypothetical protein HPB50_004420 [Hyalomma asiaticum]